MKNIFMKVTSVGIGATVGLFIATSSFGTEGDPANLVGVKTCGICHKKDETGNQLAKWQAGPHAKALETLGTARAKEVGAKLGVDNPQTSGKCLKCHSTAYYFTEEAQTQKIKPEDGVTCESCHGPGKKYMAKSTMEDREKAITGGMIYPATKQCTLCHNDQNPTFKGFDEKAAVEKIAHPNPAKK